MVLLTFQKSEFFFIACKVSVKVFFIFITAGNIIFRCLLHILLSRHDFVSKLVLFILIYIFSDLDLEKNF